MLVSVARDCYSTAVVRGGIVFGGPWTVVIRSFCAGWAISSCKAVEDGLIYVYR